MGFAVASTASCARWREPGIGRVPQLSNHEDSRDKVKAGDHNDFRNRIREIGDVIAIREGTEIAWSRNARPYMEHGWLGIAMREWTPTEAKQDERGSEEPAVEVTDVISDSPAWEAGIQKGDLIYRIDGVPVGEEGVNPVVGLARAVRSKVPDSAFTLELFRNNRTHEVTVVAAARPKAQVVPAKYPEFEPSDSGPSILELAIDDSALGPRVYEILRVFRNGSSLADDPRRRLSPYRLPDVQFVLQNPLYLAHTGWFLAEGMEAVIRDDGHPASSFMDRVYRVCGGEEDACFPGQMEPDGGSLPGLVVSLVDALVEAQMRYEDIYSVLAAPEKVRMVAWVRSLIGPDDAPEKAASEEDARESRRLLDLTEKIPVSSWIQALRPVLTISEKLVRLRNIPERFEPSGLPTSWPVTRAGDLTVIQTPAGKIVIGGQGNSVFRDDAVLTIDLGGDDRYEGCPAGASAELPITILIDFAGNDTYQASRDFCQGAAVMGGGFLFDVSGDDRYSGRNQSQGAAILGAGFLYDGAGNDLYECGYVCQGAAAFGVGGLLDRDGDDLYTSALAAQGFGFVGAVGVLMDAGGDDIYFAGGVKPDHREQGRAYQSFSQGFGLGMRPEGNFAGASGGIGVLLDETGMDTYVGDYFGQGAGYWYGLGILLDRQGDDRYLAGRYSQGAGIHFAAGLLMDEDGHDEYLSRYGVSQGCGHDVGVGILWDDGGEDRYVSGTLTHGAGNAGGIGVLADISGRDTFESRDKSDGYGSADKGRGYSSLGISMDIHSKGKGRDDRGPKPAVTWTDGYGIRIRDP